MLKLYLNGTVEVPINSYNRYTNIHDGGMTASANFSFSDISAYDDLVALGDTEITDIQVDSDNTTIYHLTNQHAHLTNISENIYDGNVSINASITFGSAKVEEDM